jgi:hypothetical protein
LAAAPASVRAELHRGYCANAIRNTSFFNRLAVLLRALTEAGVEVIPLKGIPLAEFVYKNRALRRIGDADILVKVEDMAMAERTMRALGYAQESSPRFEAVRKFAQHIPPYKKAGSVDVELHWNIGNPMVGTAVDEKGLWARSGRAKIGEVEVGTLSPADMILHLCMHMSVHHMFREHLRALFDIAETLARHEGEIAWGVFRRGCGNPAIAKGCWLALTLARKHASAAVPEEILSGLSPAGNGDEGGAAALATAEELLFCGRPSAISPSVARLWATYPLQQKIRHFCRRLFPARSEMEWMYPAGGSSPKMFFFYLRRIVGLLQRHGGKAWRLFRRETAMAADAAEDIKENALRDWMN